VKIQLSHGAGDGGVQVDWFVVRPLPGEVTRSAVGTVITNEMTVQSLAQAGRTVIELDVRPWANKAPRNQEG
jgi:hypothetical protein